MKINRRDYLKQLGAAGVLAGAAGLDVFAHEKAEPPQRTCEQNPDSAPLIWEPRRVNRFPRYADNCVTLIFEGLTGLAPRRLVREEEACGRRMERGKVVCEVGFHSKSDSGISHELEISSYSKVVDAGNCPKAEKFSGRQSENIELCVDDPEQDQAYFYQPGDVCTRRDLTDDYDFRWIVDFESDYLYRKHLSANTYLEKYDNCYSPILTVRHGIFYTLLKTSSTFLARSENNENFIDMGPIARIMAANIYVKSGVVTLKVGRHTTRIEPPGEIYFKNHCKKGANHCYFMPRDKDKKKRSDFFLNYKAFDRNGKSEYQLHLLRSGMPAIPDIKCEKKRFEEMRDRYKQQFLINDESPCSAAGYGGEYKGLTGGSGS